MAKHLKPMTSTLYRKNGDPDDSAVAPINTNLIISQILNFPEKYEEVLREVPAWELPFTLPRLQNKVSQALDKNPFPERAAELRVLYSKIGADVAKLRG